MEDALQTAFNLRRDFLVSELLKRLMSRGFAGEEPAGESGQPTEWFKVESLSRLRSAVGGRFDNLKKRWVDAGFPLREHRGDKKLEAALNEKGWRQLSAWILKQGFEARLAPEGADYLLELKSVKR
jgi:hypothetical protein